ncbi:MAG TPA: ABC transporter ATP-binding protein [Firmicutes bacterium]|jgi:iron(III) transport system ATP-binding protein|nr:ABC transporter ATP-binding protein [Bacillota bacterium]HHT41885.1 ABC transporter ATP-binding protein [Bacillota bacterium]
MSVGISIRNAFKKFGENVIIPDLSLDVQKGEFFTLLGPSGCGKTTLLRMIAGFNTIDGGEFYFDDRMINDLNPAKRNIGMVFQNYAIFPHMSVRKNVEFGLTNRNMSKTEIRQRAERFLDLMQIGELADRMPNSLSGGQQQRVALARALCIEPDVLLMDEPLSNLDAKLRVEMRTVIKHIQQTIGITTIYVTHDQEEAMAVSDRIAVMNKGVIQHVGTPKNIYQRPANTFVATFIGRSNLLEGELTMKDGLPHLKFANYEAAIPNVKEEFKTPQKIVISIRPEELVVSRRSQEGFKAVIEDSVFLGLNTHYFIRLENGTQVESVTESTIESIIEPGTEVSLTVKTEKVNLFTADGTVNILEGVQNDVISSTKAGGRAQKRLAVG